MDEFKVRIRGQLSNENAENNFLRLISGDINEHVQMARELDFKTPENGATFYSGPIAKKKAWQHAISIGSKAIEQTPGGNTFETWPWFNKKAFPENKWGTKGKDDQSIVWSALSQVYAENAHGQAEVFQEYEGNIWKGYEKPTLTKRGIPYIVHKVSSNDA